MTANSNTAVLPGDETPVVQPIAHVMDLVPGYRGIETVDWITPRDIIEALGPFDLDPCACNPQPWPTATTMWSQPEHDGLREEWDNAGIASCRAFVWMNPPYTQPLIRDWMAKMAFNNHGIALVFSKTETKHFERSVWPVASALYFFHGRVDFYRPDGTPGGKTGGQPSVLIGYGKEGLRRLLRYEKLTIGVRDKQTKDYPIGFRRPGKLIIP